MSICLKGFPIGGLVKPNYNINLFVLQEMGFLLGVLSDCEELVGPFNLASRLKMSLRTLCIDSQAPVRSPSPFTAQVQVTPESQSSL